MYIQLCICTVEPLYNEVLGTMKITLLYQVSHYIRVKKQRNIKSWDQQNYLVIRGFCYIRPRYNEVPLYIVYLMFVLSYPARGSKESIKSYNPLRGETSDAKNFHICFKEIYVMMWGKFHKPNDF